MAAGALHSLAAKSDGPVWAWGHNGSGQLGDGSTGNGRTTPAPVSDFTGIVAVAAGYDYSLALQNNGRVWAWGNDNSGQIGDGTNGNVRSAPTQLSGITGVVAIAAASDHSLALKGDGTVWTWGGNGNGRLGDGSTAGFRNAPVPVVGLENIVAIAAGDAHGLALKSDGTVWAWGNNYSGQLGKGTTDGENHPTPAQVPGFVQVRSIASGAHHNLAVKQDGSAWGWGDNLFGQLGDGTNDGRSIPTLIPGVEGLTNVIAGSFQSFAFSVQPADTTPPTGVVGSVVVESASRVYIPITVSDSGSGVAQVKLTANSTNAKLEWDSPSGVVSAPINTPLAINPASASTVVWVVKLNSAQKARVELQMWDAAGNTALVDPIIANLEVKRRGAPVLRTFNGIPQAERYVTLQNGTPGVTQVTLAVNGRIVSHGRVSDGQVVNLDVADRLRAGNRNVIRISAGGPKGATAVLTIGDTPPTANAGLSAAGSTVNGEFAP